MRRLVVRIFLVALCAGFSGCGHNDGFRNYRSNPFQFPYPEYHLKADVIDRIDHVGEAGPTRKFRMFGLTASMSAGFFDDIDTRFISDGQVYLNKNGKPVLLLNYYKEELMGCASAAMRSANMDFCAAFESTREFNEKLFLFTPEELRRINQYNPGNLWIVHKKGYVFEHTDKIYFFQLEGLAAFRQDLKDGKVQIHLFPDKIGSDFISA